MITKELLEGTRNYAKWCDVQAGDKVMIVISNEPPLVDEDVVRAISLGAEDLGAEVYQMRVKSWNYLIGEPAPDYVNGRLSEATYLLACLRALRGC